MKRISKRILALLLVSVMLYAMIPAFSMTALATTGYDRGYDGGMPGDGVIYAQGLDVSAWQEDTVDFAGVKAAGYSYVILRCGTSYGKDTYFERYYTRAKEAGLDVGAYYYSYANTVAEAIEDANDTLSFIAGKKFEYPIYFDCEDTSAQGSLTDAECANICYAYMDKVRDAEYLVGMYSMASWLKQSWVKDYGIYDTYEGWVAHYAGDGTYDAGYSNFSPTYCTMFGMYQYTSKKYVNGAGPFDANVCYKDYPSIVKKYGFNGYFTGEWKQNDTGWWYSYSDGTWAVGWACIDGEWYYFDENGYMVTGWLYDNGWYFLGLNNGIMQRGWIEDRGDWYYLDGTGLMQTGWIQDGETWYFLNEDGKMQKGWIMDGETTYYLDSYSGAMYTGWNSIDGEWHELSPQGVYYQTAENPGDRFYGKITTNVDNNKALSLDGNNVEIRTVDGYADQLWKFERQSDGSYKIINKGSGWCLDVQDASTAIGTNIQTWLDNGANAQRWVLTDDAGNGSYTLRPVSGINEYNVMDLSNADTSDGSNIVVSIENGGLNQQFSIAKCLLGDSDLSQEININDVTQIQKAISGADKADMIADVNGNGKIDIRDATHIQLYLAKIIDKFPIE